MKQNPSITMKSALIPAIAALALATNAYAGQQVSSGASKQFKQPVESLCFNSGEWQFDLFGTYVDGNSPEHAGPVRDHGWGGGIGVNYFVSRFIGFGVEGYWLDARENGSVSSSTSRRTVHNATGSIIARYPSDTTCVAPYIFLGGGVHADGDNWASGHAGLGVEFRFLPERMSFFTDARWTYFGDRYGHGDQNNMVSRAGIRFAF